MQNILDILKSDSYIIIVNIFFIILFIVFIYLFVNNINLKNKYNKFIKKLSNGKNIEEDLKNFMYKIEMTEKKNNEIINTFKSIEQELSTCIKKIGIVRYSAFKDTGSDLSFALALLDNNNNGVVLNGVYSREISNIYAKPIENGNSKYTLSDEENEAINKALNYKTNYIVNNN